MERGFGNTLSELRHARDLSQRKLASDLHISQALLSHYENGTREPGLPFVCRVCDYFGVSADFILGRSEDERSCGRVSGAVSELVHELAAIGGEDLLNAALHYVDCAAQRMCLLLDAPVDGLRLAEQNAEMALAELAVFRLVEQKSD